MCSTRTQPSARCLRDAYELLETDDDGLCCGAGGAYALWQPELANAIRNRKVGALRRAGLHQPGTMVVSANPGCVMHLRGAGVDAVHPAVLLAACARRSADAVNDYEDLVERLAVIEEDLRDRAYDQLRQAASASDEDDLHAFKTEERALLQARRAIAKAIGALDSLSGDR